MTIDWLRTYCLGLPHATEQALWGDDLVYKVGGRMFAAMPLSPVRLGMSFKCTPEDFAELTERPGIVPAPYSARMHWIALETEIALPRTEIKRLVRLSYDLAVAKLPQKAQRLLQAPPDTQLKTTKRIKSKR